MHFPLGAMSIGDLFDRSVKILLERLPTFYAINLIVMSPLIILQIAYPLFIYSGDHPTTDNDTFWNVVALAFLATLLTVLFQPISTGATLYIVVQQYHNKRTSMGKAVSFAFSRFGALLGASILVTLIVGFGMLICCVPGLVGYAICAFMTHAILLEKMGVGEAFQRSYSLWSDYAWRILVVFVLISIAYLTVSLSIRYGLEELIPTKNEIPSPKGHVTKINLQNHLIVTSIVLMAELLFITYFTVCIAMLYLDLRIRKEGFDLEMAVQMEDEEIGSRKAS